MEGRNAARMKIATYNVNSIRQRLPIVLDWMAEHKPHVMCLHETKVEDQSLADGVLACYVRLPRTMNSFLRSN
jgi:exonuclease III